MRVPQLALEAQYAALRDEIEPAVLRVLASQRFVLGQEVQAFEQEMAVYTGASHAIGCASATDALLLALMALDIGSGDEVIMSPFTFVATASAVHWLGATPVFVDIEPDSFNLDPDQIARAINSRTRAIVPVHLYGRLARMDPILQIARSCHIPVVEDAAQALGARMNGRMAGTFGAIGCYSFYPTKNLGGAGDGGMLVTSDARLAARLRRLRVYGAERRYHYTEIGLNSRLDELQAAVLRVKLRHLDDWNQARRLHAERYNRALAGVVRTPTITADHIFHQYVIRVENRDSLQQRLAGRGVEAVVYYPLPLHLQKCFGYLRHNAGDFPQAEAVAREVLALPLYPELSADARDYVAAAVREWVTEVESLAGSARGRDVRSQ